MINCKQFNDLASDYLDGNLTLKQQISIKFHALMCRYCRLFLSQLTMSSKLLSHHQPGHLSEQEMESQVDTLLGVAQPDNTGQPPSQK